MASLVHSTQWGRCEAEDLPMRLAILSFLTLTLALPALADDGVLEINQACAVSAGCFVGDSGSCSTR